MRAMIESLESREMFSVVPHAVPHPVRLHVPAIHRPVIQKAQKPAIHAAATVSPAMMFAGTAIDSKNESSELLVTVTRTDAGYSATVRIIDPDGTTHSFTMTSDASGAFSYNGLVGKETAEVHVQLSADRNSMAGGFSSVRDDGTINTGTISLSRTLVPQKFFVGRGQDGTGKGAMLMVVVTPTVTGYVAQIRCINPDGSVGGVIITGNTAGHFVFDGPDQDGMPLRLEAQLSVDGLVVTGSFTSTNSDGSTHGGTFTLNRT